MRFGAVDIFCGVGGLTYGICKSNIEVVAGYDLDENCKYAYESNNKSKFINKNIKDVEPDEIKHLLRPYDVKILVGCAPCQPFSSHQKDKKNRKKHKDWNLLYEFARLVKEVLPDVVSMENVPEIIKEKVFDDFLDVLFQLNYKVNYKVIDASLYGVPQRRKRIILIAGKNKYIPIEKSTCTTPVTVYDAIGSLPAVKAGCSDKFDKLHVSANLSNININRIQCSLPGGTWHDWPSSLLLECHKKKSGSTYTSVYGRMEWDKIAPTITTQFYSFGTGRFGHPEQDRALTLREGAILQSFPENYSFLRDNDNMRFCEIARYIGNAVPPKLGEVIGKSIVNSFVKNEVING